MATGQFLTKERMEEIEAQCIIDGAVDLSSNLILERFDGTTINAGNVKGTRFGTTNAWALPTASNAVVSFNDGLPPRVGDMVISSNGFDVGGLYRITAVIDSTHADVTDTTIKLKGPAGNTGATGATGAAGTNADWMSGSGAPSSGLGNPGDWYLDEDTSDVYQKLDGTTWNLETNIKGDPGPEGPEGPAGSGATLDQAWPIGSVYISVVSTDPSTFFGGTWTALPSGKMLLTLDSGDAAMDTALETGGSKTKTIGTANLPPHTHVIDHDHAAFNVTLTYNATSAGGSNQLRVNDVGGVTGGTGTSGNIAINMPNYTGSSGNGGFANTPLDVMNPYVVIYAWRRTA